MLGEKASEDSYILPIDKEEKLSRCTVREKSGPVAGESFPKSASAADSIHNEKLRTEKVSTSSEDLKNTSAEEKEKIIQNTVSEASNSSSKSDDLSHYISAEETHSPDSSDVDDKNVRLINFFWLVFADSGLSCLPHNYLPCFSSSFSCFMFKIIYFAMF